LIIKNKSNFAYRYTLGEIKKQIIKYMEKPIYEHPEDTASDLMKNDYLNEYLTFNRLLYDEGSKYKKPPLAPRGFSQRYPNMTFSGLPFKISEIDRQKIEELDKLSVEANRLLNETPSDTNALLKIVILVAEICGRPDFANNFRGGAKE